jgi:hypothetical protein
MTYSTTNTFKYIRQQASRLDIRRLFTEGGGKLEYETDRKKKKHSEQF